MSSRAAMNMTNPEDLSDSLDSTDQEIGGLIEEDMAAPPTSRLLMRRVVQPVGVLAVATVLGYAGYAVHFQTRLRDPIEPATDLTETKNLDAFTELTMTSSMTDRTHCNGLAALGRPTAYCNPYATCCINDGGWAYCCATGNECYRNVCVAGPGQCFPGEASVALADGSKKRLDDLKVGEQVLVEDSAGSQRYEPVLDFLHQVPGRHESLTVEHARGTFRVSANHLVFAQDGMGRRFDKIAVQLKVGDLIYLPSNVAETEQVARVLSVHSSEANSGMHAPLTASGTIVVDGIVASNYATHSQATWIPHGAIHAAFLPVRMYHLLGHSMQSKSDVTEGGVEIHPYADLLLSHLAMLPFESWDSTSELKARHQLASSSQLEANGPFGSTTTLRLHTFLRVDPQGLSVAFVV